MAKVQGDFGERISNVGWTMTFQSKTNMESETWWFLKGISFSQGASCHVSFSGEYNPYKTNGWMVTVTNEGLWGFLLEM